MADFHRKDSFLKYAGVYDNFLDVNRLPKVPKGDFDAEYVITEAEANRPDLLAHKMYGNTRLWWVFSLRNPDILKDPLGDFKSGVVIKLPSPEVVKSLMG